MTLNEPDSWLVVIGKLMVELWWLRDEDDSVFLCVWIKISKIINWFTDLLLVSYYLIWFVCLNLGECKCYTGKKLDSQWISW